MGFSSKYGCKKCSRLINEYGILDASLGGISLKNLLKFSAVVFWSKISRSFITNRIGNKVLLKFLEPVISLPH